MLAAYFLLLVFWTPSIAPQWHLIELKKNTIQYKCGSFHHKNAVSLFYYYEKEFNYFLFAKEQEDVTIWVHKRVAL